MNIRLVNNTNHVQDSVHRIAAAFASLPRRQREVFLASRLDGMTYVEISDRTGLTVQQVERHMSRALYKLMKQMEGHKLRWWERWF
jgi:RNA polymerase sigma-70 factor (ECF subfamily)